MLDVRRIQVLRAVVSSGLVTAAAANLGYPPSAISQQIATLEREAGIALLEKEGRQVRPTVAGRMCAERADVIAGNLADAESAAEPVIDIGALAGETWVDSATMPGFCRQQRRDPEPIRSIYAAVRAGTAEQLAIASMLKALHDAAAAV
jgi:DNA-binding transcriptional ArsR family regulator